MDEDEYIDHVDDTDMVPPCLRDSRLDAMWVVFEDYCMPEFYNTSPSASTAHLLTGLTSRSRRSHRTTAHHHSRVQHLPVVRLRAPRTRVPFRHRYRSYRLVSGTDAFPSRSRLEQSVG